MNLFVAILTFVNKVMDFVPWLVKRFSKTPSEEKDETDKQVKKESEQSKKTGRPVWDED